MGLLEEPSTLVAAMGIERQLNALQKGGAAGGFNRKRNRLRASKVARTLTFLKAAVEVFCNRATCPLQKQSEEDPEQQQPWRKTIGLKENQWEEARKETFGPQNFLLMQPFLCSNEQVAALAVTTLLNQWADPMQAYPLQQLFEHGNAGKLEYRRWAQENRELLKTKLPFETSKLNWVMPALPVGGNKVAGGMGFEILAQAGAHATTPPFAYVRFGPIPRAERSSGNFLWRASVYVSQIIENAGGQHMSPSSVKSILSELLNTPYDALLYSTSGKFEGLQSLKVVRLDETSEHLEVLESWVRASYSEAHQHATARAVGALGHAHTRERTLLTATQTMFRRGFRVLEEDVCLPQFLEAVPLLQTENAPWTVRADPPEKSARDVVIGEDGKLEAESAENLSTEVQEDVETWELRDYLGRGGYSETFPREWERALRAHSEKTTEDTLEFFRKTRGLTKEAAAKRVGLYPDRWIEKFLTEEKHRRERTQAISGALGGGEAKKAQKPALSYMAQLQRAALQRREAPPVAPPPPPAPAKRAKEVDPYSAEAEREQQEEEEEEEEEEDYQIFSESQQQNLQRRIALARAQAKAASWGAATSSS